MRTQAEEARQRESAKKREQTKRVRNQELMAPGTASPPSKRGSQSRTTKRSTGNSMADMLEEFRA